MLIMLMIAVERVCQLFQTERAESGSTSHGAHLCMVALATSLASHKWRLHLHVALGMRRFQGAEESGPSQTAGASVFDSLLRSLDLSCGGVLHEAKQRIADGIARPLRSVLSIVKPLAKIN